MAVPACDLSAEPRECRRNAEAALEENAPAVAQVWALLAIAGELAEMRREQRKARRS
jgi:hypothetical protein